MKSHTARPLSEELEELYSIAKREHGPQGRSTRAIQKSLNDLRDKEGRPAKRDGEPRMRPSERGR